MFISLEEKKINCWLCNLGKEATSQTESYKVKIEPYVDRMQFHLFLSIPFFSQKFHLLSTATKKEHMKVLVMLIWLDQIIPIVNLL